MHFICARKRNKMILEEIKIWLFRKKGILIIALGILASLFVMYAYTYQFFMRYDKYRISYNLYSEWTGYLSTDDYERFVELCKQSHNESDEWLSDVMDFENGKISVWEYIRKCDEANYQNRTRNAYTKMLYDVEYANHREMDRFVINSSALLDVMGGFLPWPLLVSLLVSALFIFAWDAGNGANTLIRLTRLGRSRKVCSKLIVMLYTCALSIGLLWIINCAVVGNWKYMGFWNYPIQSCAIGVTTYKLTIWQMLLLLYIYSVLSVMVPATIVYLVSEYANDRYVALAVAFVLGYIWINIIPNGYLAMKGNYLCRAIIIMIAAICGIVVLLRLKNKENAIL